MVRVLLVLLTCLYPLLVYFGLQHFDVRFVVLLLLLVVAARLFSQKHSGRLSIWVTLVGGGGLAAWVWVTGSPMGLKLYPVFVNAFLLGIFALSLLYPPTVIEKMARLQEPDLPDHATPYIQKVTGVWCAFFIINGSISLWTVVYGTDEQWALYNGAVSYGLIGALMSVEWCVRQWVRRHE